MSLGDRLGGAVGPVPPTAGGVIWPPVGPGFEPTGFGFPAWLARSSARFFSYTPNATPASASSVATTARAAATPVARDRGAPGFGRRGGAAGPRPGGGGVAGARPGGGVGGVAPAAGG